MIELTVDNRSLTQSLIEITSHGVTLSHILHIIADIQQHTTQNTAYTRKHNLGLVYTIGINEWVIYPLNTCYYDVLYIYNNMYSRYVADIPSVYTMVKG